MQRLLVVAPLSAHEAWLKESTDCFRSPLATHRFDHRKQSTEIAIVSYQSLPRRLEDVRRWVTSAPCHVVLDEAHRIKRETLRLGSIVQPIGTVGVAKGHPHGYPGAAVAVRPLR